MPLIRRLFLLALVVLLGTAGTVAWAQPRPALSITMPAREQVTKVGPAVAASHMLAGSKLQELLSSGFPARLHFVVELWSVGGWANELERVTEWDVVVRRIALENVYEVTQIAGDHVYSLGKFALLSDAEAAVGRPVRASIVASPGRKRFYYQATLAVETLALSDLDEVERWLRGEFRPAVQGRRNPGTALSRGIKTLASRLLGGERREYEERTAVFGTLDDRR